MPSTARPKKPNMTLFYGKNIVAKCDPTTFKLSGSEKEDGTPSDPQIAVEFVIGPKQRGTYYSVAQGQGTIREGDFAEIPEGTRQTLIKSLSEKAAPYTIDALRAAGWTGTSFAALLAGKFEGLGDTEVNLTIEVEETDNRNGEWLMKEFNGEMKFSPRQRINFVNRMGGGFNFKTTATTAEADALDEKLKKILTAADPRAMAEKKPKATDPNAGNAGGNLPPADGDEIPF